MKRIEFEHWIQDTENRKEKADLCRSAHSGRCFHELEAHLDSVGYLPDEYLLLDSRWQNGREMPRDANFLQDRLRRKRGHLSECVSGLVRGQSAQDRAFHDRQNAGRKRRRSGSNVPHFLCDYESDPRRQQCPRAVHGGRKTARAGRNDVLEPVSRRTATGGTGAGGTVHPTRPAGRGRRNLLRRMVGNVAEYMDAAGLLDRLGENDRALLDQHDGAQEAAPVMGNIQL